MPIYEFKCKSCGKIFEVLFRSRDEKLKVICPQCRSEKATKLFSVFGSKVDNAPSGPDLPCASCSEFS